MHHADYLKFVQVEIAPVQNVPELIYAHHSTRLRDYLLHGIVCRSHVSSLFKAQRVCAWTEELHRLWHIRQALRFLFVGGPGGILNLILLATSSALIRICSGGDAQGPETDKP